MNKKSRNNFPKWVKKHDYESNSLENSSASLAPNEYIKFSKIVTWHQGQICIDSERKGFVHLEVQDIGKSLPIYVESRNWSLFSGDGRYISFDSFANLVFVSSIEDSAKVVIHPDDINKYAISNADGTRFLRVTDNKTFEQKSFAKKWGTYRLEI